MQLPGPQHRGWLYYQGLLDKAVDSIDQACYFRWTFNLQAWICFAVLTVEQQLAKTAGQAKQGLVAGCLRRKGCSYSGLLWEIIYNDAKNRIVKVPILAKMGLELAKNAVLANRN